MRRAGPYQSYFIIFFAIAAFLHAMDGKEQDSNESTEFPAAVSDYEFSPPSRDLRQVLSGGNGYDWMALSTKERLELCLIVEQTIGQHDLYEYRNFLFEFYDKADRENPSLLSKPISEVAAVAAAMKFED